MIFPSDKWCSLPLGDFLSQKTWLSQPPGLLKASLQIAHGAAGDHVCGAGRVPCAEDHVILRQAVERNRLAGLECCGSNDPRWRAAAQFRVKKQEHGQLMCKGERVSRGPLRVQSLRAVLFPKNLQVRSQVWGIVKSLA